MNQAGVFTKSASAFASKPQSVAQSPTYQGYACFAKAPTPVSIPSQVPIPDHMRSPSYAATHAAKSAINDKHIDINDLEEGVKLAILADTERDQRLLMKKKN